MQHSRALDPLPDSRALVIFTGFPPPPPSRQHYGDVKMYVDFALNIWLCLTEFLV